MYLLIETWKGNIEQTWVSNDMELIIDWRDQVDAERGIERDEEGVQTSVGDWEVRIHTVDQYKITLTIDNEIAMN